MFEGRNGSQMFDKLEDRIAEFMESNKGSKISYQLYDKELDSALVLTIVAPHTQRVHSKV